MFLLDRSFLRKEVTEKHQSRLRENSSWSLGFLKEILNSLLRLNEVGSSTNCVRIRLDMLGWSSWFVGSIDDTRLRSSGKIRFLASAVAEHSVTMCWIDSTGLKHRRHCWSEFCLWPSSSKLGKSPVSSCRWALSFCTCLVSVIPSRDGCGLPDKLRSWTLRNCSLEFFAAFSLNSFSW